MNNRLKKVVKRDILLLLIIVGYFLFAHFTGISIPCFFYEITGYKCPGCGITHLFFALFKFDFIGAFKYNPLVFILLPSIIFYFIYNDYIYVTGKEDKIIKKIPTFVWIILIVIVILFGILRNIL